MRIRTLSIRISLFLFISLALSLTSFAQTFEATKAPAKADQGLALYQIDIDALNAYVKNQTDHFPLSLNFTETKQWALSLEPNELRSPNYQLRTSDGVIHRTAASPTITYKGTITGEPDTQVRMTITDGFFDAVIIDSEDKQHHIQIQSGDVPLFSLTNQPANTFAGTCATGHDHKLDIVHDFNQKTNDSSSLSYSIAPYETEIAFVVDRLAYAEHETLEDLEQELLTILNYTDAYYAQHQLTYRLTETFVVTDLESQPWDEKADPGNMLDEFTDWAGTDGVLNHHDVATLWTGISFGSTIGIAWIDVIGRSYKQNVVNFDGGRARRNSNIHTHELGHNWGSDHVNSGGWIMSAFLSNSDQESEWHSSTFDAFPNYIANAMTHLDDLEDETTVLPVNLAQIELSNESNNNNLLDPGESVDLNVMVENAEDVSIENLLVTMLNDNNRAKTHVTINTSPVTLSALGANTTASITFNISLSAEAPFDKSLRFLFQLSDGDRTTEFTASIDSGDELLPVDLVSFEAVSFNDNVQLEWQTASENNNAGFQVELQFNGGPFKELSFVQGAGTTLTTQNYRHTLNNLSPGDYGFRLKQTDFDGTFEYSDVVYLTMVPQSYGIAQNYPNPFNPQTRISFHLPIDTEVSLEVFDMLGRRISVLVNAYLNAGQHAVMFDGANLPNGTYLYRIKAGTFEEMKTMILMK